MTPEEREQKKEGNIHIKIKFDKNKERKDMVEMIRQGVGSDNLPIFT